MYWIVVSTLSCFETAAVSSSICQCMVCLSIQVSEWYFHLVWMFFVWVYLLSKVMNISIHDNIYMFTCMTHIWIRWNDIFFNSIHYSILHLECIRQHCILSCIHWWWLNKTLDNECYNRSCNANSIYTNILSHPSLIHSLVVDFDWTWEEQLPVNVINKNGIFFSTDSFRRRTFSLSLCWQDASSGRVPPWWSQHIISSLTM